MNGKHIIAATVSIRNGNQQGGALAAHNEYVLSSGYLRASQLGSCRVCRVLRQQAQGRVKFKVCERLRNTLNHMKRQLRGNLRLPGIPKLPGIVIALLQQVAQAG